MFYKRVIFWKQGIHQRTENCRVFWARLASFGQLGLISDPQIFSKFHNGINDPKVAFCVFVVSLSLLWHKSFFFFWHFLKSLFLIVMSVIGFIMKYILLANRYPTIFELRLWFVDIRFPMRKRFSIKRCKDRITQERNLWIFWTQNPAS